jgi:N-ethylmaleimide reductase
VVSLLQPYELGSLRLPNRVVMAPMTRVRATRDGLAVPSTATYYAQRATAGLIVSEGAQPSRPGQSNPHTPGLHSDAAAMAWRPVTAAVHANGGRIFAQIMHGGRVSHPDTTGFVPVAPSAVRLPAEVFTPAGPRPAPIPRALSRREVPGEVAVYAEAARRAVDAGFDGVELHGANGYLIQQFLSSNVNQRTDEYGGSLTGRIRFAVEAAEATADAIGAERVGLRLFPGGTVGDIVEDDPLGLYTALYRALAPLGLAYLHTVMNGDRELFDALRRQWPGTYIVNPSAGIVGRPADRAAGLTWLARGADLISYGRAFLANPDLIERFRTGLPLREADPERFYAGGDDGYITYSSHQY